MFLSEDFFRRHGNVYLYVPNLIGYLRVCCSLYAFAVALKSPTLCVASYFLGFVCDELDGRFARMLNQTSTLGAVLDMITDRLSTAGLLCLLCMLYPQRHIVFLCLLVLDISSHWLQMYASLAAGSATHKDTKSKSLIVRLYYTHRLFMGYCCVSCEVLYLMLYLLHWDEYRSWPSVSLPISRLPLATMPALKDIFPSGWGERLPVAVLLSLMCLPGFLIKQITNCFQLKVSSDMLVAADVSKMEHENKLK